MPAIIHRVSSRPFRFATALAAVIACMLVPTTARSQERLLVRTNVRAGAIYENWSFPTAIATAAPDGGTAYTSGASQLTIPVAVITSIAPGWTADLYTSYVRGEVRDAQQASAASPSAHRLDGVTDTKLRVTGQLAGDAVLFTAGLTLPTGTTDLNPEELDALGVLASPGLRFQSPVLGAGAGATAGLILTRVLGEWAMALGGSYELRRSYTPAGALQAGLPAGDLRPGNALHLSLAGERVRGAVRQLLSATADLYQHGELRDGAEEASVGGATVASLSATSIGLGRSVGGTYELGVTGHGADVALFLTGRRRGDFAIQGATVPGSARTEIDGGVQLVRALSPTTALRFGVDGRFQSVSTAADGSADDASAPAATTFATAGVRAIGATAAARFGGARSGMSIEPYVRAQYARLDFRTTTATGTGLSAGAIISAGF